MTSFPLPLKSKFERKTHLRLDREFLENFSFPYDARSSVANRGTIEIKANLERRPCRAMMIPTSSLHKQLSNEQGRPLEDREHKRNSPVSCGAYGPKQTFAHLCGRLKHQEEVKTMFASFSPDRQTGLIDLAVSHVADLSNSDACIISCKVLKLFIKSLQMGSFCNPLDAKYSSQTSSDKKLLRRVLKKLTRLRDQTETMSLRSIIVKLLFETRLLSDDATKLRATVDAEEALCVENKGAMKKEKNGEGTGVVLSSASMSIMANIDGRQDARDIRQTSELTSYLITRPASGSVVTSSLVTTNAAPNSWEYYPQFRNELYHRHP